MRLKFPVWCILCIVVVLLLHIPASVLLADRAGDEKPLTLNSVVMHRDHGDGGDDDDPTPPPDEGDPTPEPDEGDPTPPPDEGDPHEEPTEVPDHRPTEIPKEDGPREQRPAPYLDLTYECTAAGTTFTLINYGGDMQSVEQYTLSDGTSGEYQLPWRQSLTVTAGFGAVSIDAGAAGSLAVACQRPPQLTISGVCVPETGVWFTIHNDGGSMPEPQVYTLDNTTTDTFRLGEGGQVQIAAGFGDPVFFSDGLTTRMGTLCKPVGSISGMIWSDVDGNGVHDVNEPGLANVMVSLMADGDPVTLKTAADGLYAFDVVPASYRITVTLPEGFENNLLLTADPDGALDGAADITIAPADRAEWVGNFGYQPTQMGSISGLVWLETHDFGQHDADESGLAGAAVHLLDARGELMRTARLPMDGHYAFEDLPPGLYSIMVDTASLPAQMFATFEPDGNLDFLTTISLHPGEALQDVEFGIVGPF